ncbi:unnamed protein product [Auanema sp. JU1783]|nr:unnamed protein product [Auanema sp. JU1783]
MKLRFLSSVLPQQEGAARIESISCAPNGLKTAIAQSDRTIVLIDENGQQKDRFATKPIESKFGKKSYFITSVAFSPDSSCLAVGQSDNVVFIYKIGYTWNEKKVIVNKLKQSSTVTSLIWPFEDKVIIGLLDGKVRCGLLKSNKCSSLYKTSEPVVSLASNPRKTAFLSGHADGSILIFNFASKNQSKICTLQISPFCLAFTSHGFLVAGSDRRILSYTENGIVQQQFDYSDQAEKEFSALITDPTGQNVAVASYDRIRLFSWSSRRGAWDEGVPLDIKNIYSVTSLAWKGDGSAVYAGTICGGVISIDCCLRRGMLKSRFETTYVSPSHVIVRDITTDFKTNVISNRGLSIDELKMMGKDKFVHATTSSTIILADTSTGKSSELEWRSGGNEKFYFDFENVCILINAGEITVIEYGIDGAIGWIRTELTSPQLMSIRISYPSKNGPIKKIAYLPDPTTISLVNFLNGQQEMALTHTSAIDWLELNEEANLLLFRDKRSRVILVDLATERQTTLISFCTYVQWVPMSDVIVAQSGDTLHIWYNPETPEQITNVQIAGEVENVIRDVDKTEVIVQEGTAKVSYELDNTQIEFGSALDKNDFERAITYLETQRNGLDTYMMWRRVGELALNHQRLCIAQRCFAAINDIALVNMLHETVDYAEKAALELGGDGTQYYKVRANLALLNKNFKQAEKAYLESNAVDEAVQMYQTLHKWDDALELAKATHYSGYEQLKSTYLRALYDSGQEGKAADLKVSEGDHMGAIHLFLKANQPAKALNVVNSQPQLAKDDRLLETIADALLKGFVYDKAGDIFEKMKNFEKALECYRKGHAFSRAVQLARTAFPEEVVVLEEQWGDHLVSESQHDAAISHYLEANKSLKAVEAAMNAQEWSKAVQIVDVIQDEATSKTYYGKIAEYYAGIGDLERAERLFIEADLHKLAIAMYVRNNKWAEAYRLSEEFLGKEETASMYINTSQELEEQGRYAEAEQLYIAIGASSKAIQMYRKANRHDDMIRLVEKYHNEHLLETHKRLGMEFEESGDMKAAEEEYLKAGDWKAAITMYRENEMWADAYRLAKSDGGEQTQKQIAFLWAKSLGGEAAVKLLNKFGMLSDTIDNACENGAFDFAFDLAKIGMKERLPDVHLRMAMYLEEEGKLDEAARHFVEAGKADEATAMYIHDEDWEAAERIAQEHAPQALNNVYLGQAQKALDEGDHPRAESYFLRANRPDLILNYFKDTASWPDALRIAKEYLPHQLPHLQEEYDKAELRSGARGIDSYLAQAKEWEQQSEWSRAVQSYLRVSPDATSNEEILKQSALKAADLAIKFLIGMDNDLFGEVLQRLEDLQLYEKQAEALLVMGNTKQSIHALCKAQLWSKAKQVAMEYLPEMVPEIETAYKESLKNEGRLGELIDVDVISAIDLMIANGQWEKALDTAKQQNHRPLIDKYVAMYAAELIQQDDIPKLLKVFERYGASSNSSSFNLYKMLFSRAVNLPPNSEMEFAELIAIRDLFLNLIETMRKEKSEFHNEFERYLYALSLMSMRISIKNMESTEAKRLYLKQSIALLRYTDLLPADRVFYEAGTASKDFGGDYEAVAFILLNHYLDLVDAIDEGNVELVDYSMFENTDIPTEVPLPEKQWLNSVDHEEVKEWVLATSVDDNGLRELPLDNRGSFESSLVDDQGSSFPQCIISGYPVLTASVDLGRLAAIKEELNRFLVMIKTNPTDDLINVQEFLSKWAETPLTMAI